MRIAFIPITVSVLAGAAQCRAQLVGGGWVSLQAWNDEANTGGYADIANAGEPVTVWRLYAAFDDSAPASEIRVVGAHLTEVLFQSDRPMINITDQFPAPSDWLFDPRLLWDMFLTIGIDDINDGYNPVEYELTVTSHEIDGAWLSHPSASDQGEPDLYGGADDFGTGLNLVMLAQITVAGNPPPGDVVRFHTDLTIPSVGNFSGELGVSYTVGAGYDLRWMPLTYCAGDADDSGAVDGADLAVLLANWGGSDPILDFTADGAVDGADLAVLLANWGACP